jgi:hypothetical protein
MGGRNYNWLYLGWLQGRSYREWRINWSIYVLGIRVCSPRARCNRNDEANEHGYSAVRAGMLAWATIKTTIAGRRGGSRPAIRARGIEPLPHAFTSSRRCAG